MKKTIVLLILALICGSSVYADVDIPQSSQGAATATVIINQKHPDSSKSASSEGVHGEYISKDDCDRMFSDYINHVGWVVGLVGGIFGVLITMVVGLLGALVPYMTNKSFREEFNGKIKKINKDIREHNKKINGSNKKIDSQDEEIKRQIRILATSFASQAMIIVDKDKQIVLFGAAITLDPTNPKFYNYRAKCYIIRGKEGDYEKAMEDIKKGLSLNPDESTRKELEEKKAELEAKMKGQKTD